jgi:hypothetical protein
MIEQDIKLLEHCVLDLQRRVIILERKTKVLQRRAISLELQAECKDEPITPRFAHNDHVESENDHVEGKPKWTCARCGCENLADFKWCFHCGFHKPERSE